MRTKLDEEGKVGWNRKQQLPQIVGWMDPAAQHNIKYTSRQIGRCDDGKAVVVSGRQRLCFLGQ